ncbi:unnamed protein product [Symbiodinium sp. CCMP2456]|nr:unnamed protein product [Symbiodinium sp. CCMP2456]
MGAATAFRSCEAAGAPMPAFYRAVLLMRRELLKWASAPFSTSGRAASLDAARGAALCAQLCQTHPVAPQRRDAGDRAIFRRLQRPVQQALQALLGAWRPPVLRQRHLQTSHNIADRSTKCSATGFEPQSLTRRRAHLNTRTECKELV